MTKSIKITLGAFFFIVSAILLLQIDDDLHPEAQAMYDKATEHKESKAYIYYWGIQTALDEDPQEAGQIVFDLIKQAEISFFKQGSLSEGFDKINYPNKIYLPSYYKPSFKSKSPDAISWLFKVTDYSLESLSQKETVLLSRYKKFINMDDFHTLVKPNVFAPLPSYQFAVQASEHKILSAIDSARKNDLKRAITILLDNISGLRNHYKQEDILIGKVIYESVISRNLDVLSILLHKNKYRIPVSIAPLSDRERDYEQVMNQEFSGAYSILSTGSFSTNEILNIPYLPDWIINMLFKRNMSLNALSSVSRRITEYSKLSKREFTNIIQKSKNIKYRKPYLRNYFGAKLSNDTLIQENYVGRTFALDAKIRLFNQLSLSSGFLDDVSQISNPFYDGEKKVYFSEDKRSICFDVPVKIKEQRRCLRVKLN